MMFTVTLWAAIVMAAPTEVTKCDVNGRNCEIVQVSIGKADYPNPSNY